MVNNTMKMLAIACMFYSLSAHGMGRALAVGELIERLVDICDSYQETDFNLKRVIHEKKIEIREKGENATPEAKHQANIDYKNVWPILHDDDSSEVFPGY